MRIRVGVIGGVGTLLFPFILFPDGFALARLSFLGGKLRIRSTPGMLHLPRRHDLRRPVILIYHLRLGTDWVRRMVEN